MLLTFPADEAMFFRPLRTNGAMSFRRFVKALKNATISFTKLHTTQMPQRTVVCRMFSIILNVVLILPQSRPWW